MLITIKYFGQIAEITNKNEETLEFSGHNVSELLSRLNQKYSQLAHLDFKVAQHQKLVSIDAELTGDEIALLPPFAGG